MRKRAGNPPYIDLMKGQGSVILTNRVNTCPFDLLASCTLCPTQNPLIKSGQLAATDKSAKKQKKQPIYCTQQQKMHNIYITFTFIYLADAFIQSMQSS